MPSKEITPITVENLPIDIQDGKTYSIAQSNPNTFTHIYFKYPCRFIPEIPRWAIKKYLGNNKGVIFDPFAGSGTTLLEGIINKHDSYGTEIDSIAKLIIKVKTTALTNDQIIYMNTVFKDIIYKVSTADIPVVLPEINNLDHWFSEENKTYLGKIKYLVDKVDDNDVRDFLNLCFVSIIKKVSYADDVSPKPYVSSKVIKTPPNALEEYIQVFNRYFNAIKDFSKLEIGNQAKLVEEDALNIKINFKVDLAITSPPYINAFDYARTLRLENLWMGDLSEKDIREKKKDYVGTESLSTIEEEKDLEILTESNLLNEYYSKIYPIDRKRALVVKRFFSDMKKNLEEVKRILVVGGHYVIVIGNSTIRKVEIESWKVIEDIANNLGFKSELHFDYVIQNPYIRIPRRNRGGIISFDHVLVLKKIQ
ncbi:DNA methyltransferase [Proteiniclasticum ruminis]|uniref:DNA methyltransferase n=1 Tax=Proteiniclasticum ruminis TaxID=398199 RepID=UPI0028A7E8DC|nr:DNA methyltransferase [Proteiniclasticum ruminis]